MLTLSTYFASSNFSRAGVKTLINMSNIIRQIISLSIHKKDHGPWRSMYLCMHKNVLHHLRDQGHVDAISNKI